MSTSIGWHDGRCGLHVFPQIENLDIEFKNCRCRIGPSTSYEYIYIYMHISACRQRAKYVQFPSITCIKKYITRESVCQFWGNTQHRRTYLFRKIISHTSVGLPGPFWTSFELKMFKNGVTKIRPMRLHQRYMPLFC